MTLNTVKSPHICLIVDNPLRDLEGLVLLARQLAARGATVTLTPMYDQGFDVPALRPDFVLLNYIRANNLDLIKLYKRLGIKVGVLDTEGIGGKNPDHFAELVSNTGDLDLVDLYCVWGEAQYEAFQRRQVVPQSRLHVTGCPRYDYCAAPWRSALTRFQEPGYILINTNFPTVNPRFSEGSESEFETMRKVGFSDKMARRFIVDGKHSHQQVIKVTERLATRFKDHRFVLRPHPFERLSAYDTLTSLDNVSLRQEGTSLDWISGAKLLLHQNCSTAIEGGMLGVEAVSLEWFNTPALLLEAASRVSHAATSYEFLESLIADILQGQIPVLSKEQQEFRQQMLRELYFAIDGRASERITDAIFTTLQNAPIETTKEHSKPNPSLRGRVVNLMRAGLSYNTSIKLQRLLSSGSIDARRAGKSFTAQELEKILHRLNEAAGNTLDVLVRSSKSNAPPNQHRLGPASLQISLQTPERSY